jgi:hypothetical protein
MLIAIQLRFGGINDCLRVDREDPTSGIVCPPGFLMVQKILTAQGRFLRNPVVIAQVAGIIGAKNEPLWRNGQ